jgi:RNA polymerase sigma factor (sigma-70 family)
VSEKEFLSQLKEHQNIIYKLVHLYATSEEDKKDLYQEILFQAWKTYSSFRGEAKFSTWLYRLSLNTIFTIQRKVDGNFACCLFLIAPDPREKTSQMDDPLPSAFQAPSV